MTEEQELFGGKHFLPKSFFARDVKTIGKHINNALKEELANMATVAKFAIVQIEGGRTVTRQIEYYNLDMILSVGYRVKSNRGIEFRRWSNNVLKNYLLKGYSINQRLKDLGKKMFAFSKLNIPPESINFLRPNKSPCRDISFYTGMSAPSSASSGAERRNLSMAVTLLGALNKVPIKMLNTVVKFKIFANFAVESYYFMFNN